MSKPIRKITHKDVSKMSSSEFFDNAKIPFLRLLSYVRPYKRRFVAGIVFGVLFGLFNGVMLLTMKFVFEVVLPRDGESARVVLAGDGGKRSIDVTLIDPEVAAQMKDRQMRPGTGLPTGAEGVRQLELPLPAGKEGEVAQITLPIADNVTYKIPFFGEVKLPQPRLSRDGSMWIVIAFCMIIPVLILIRGLLSYLSRYYMIWVGNKVLFDLRDQCFTKLMHHSMGFYSKQKTGELIQTVFNQTRMAQTAGTELSSNLVKHPISIMAIVLVLFWLDWVFALCALVLFPLCILPVLLVSKKVRKAGGKEEQEAGMLMVVMQESFAGIRVVKSHAREDFERERFNAANTKMLEFIMRWKKAMEIVAPLVETTASLGIAAGLVYAWATQMSAGTFLILYAALIALYPHAKALGTLQIHLQKCLVASTKVFAIIDLDAEIQDRPDAVAMNACEGLIEFDNVSFSYSKNVPAVQGVSLVIPPGTTCALVGESGAGKSTLFSMLMRFYDPQQGSIRIDGRDLRDYTQESLRDNIGIVNQDSFLFHDTIANNIRYGKLDATDEEVEEAARRAHAHEFIIEQPNGYQTIVGDKGSSLSGGQAQRISIARAFIRNAPILLLDEATSNLDSKSEQHIQNALNDLTAGRTVIAIAHRLSTIRDANAIVMMAEGRVIDVGRHDELVVRCAEYRHLYELQYAEPQLAAPAGV
jgi:ABC-type multidrug transport system fused ATPase/permease subunit